MSEIFTKLWINIENFNYLDKNKLSVNKSDVETLKQSRRNFLLKPGVCLLITLIFSRHRNRLWTMTKDYFLGNRSLRREINSVENITKPQIKSQKVEKVIIEYRNNNNLSDFDEANRIAISNSRNLSTRKRNTQAGVEYMNLPRTEPTISEQYFGFMDKYRTNVKKFVFFKNYVNKFTGKENVYHKGENFILKTKLIYIPFVILLIFATYDLALTYVGLYFKYQPLVDEYYIYTKNKKI